MCVRVYIMSCGLEVLVREVKKMLSQKLWGNSAFCSCCIELETVLR